LSLTTHTHARRWHAGRTPVSCRTEQYIIKPPSLHRTAAAAGAFAWHTDGACAAAARGRPVASSPHLCLWVALDDMRRDNGCLVVLPRAQGARAAWQTAAVCAAGGRHSSGSGSSSGWASGSSQPPAGARQQLQYLSVSSTQQLLEQLSHHLHDHSWCGGSQQQQQQQTGASCGWMGQPPPLGLLLPAGTAVSAWLYRWQHCLLLHCCDRRHGMHTGWLAVCVFIKSEVGCGCGCGCVCVCVCVCVSSTSRHAT
jgi:hypothetical protein